ncbi:helix-turn-helix domain-containing protein [Arthrobacter sp. Sa2BUA2]|uniref:Helix-turn-helix domain-containing protein n=1 Tax=Arthrobacter pullicola TaxID=2762224 RepID=A0ABR8YEW3_9MICC|nr:helix-turn-helix domain-containing protein [Arthrobacter pullicola]MBD8042765.1 helix-turn-helix domain-containing protein [Arthrobacter pullicola]
MTETPGSAFVPSTRSLPREPSGGQQWEDLIQRLWVQRDTLVSDFLSRFEAVSYDDARVPPEDVYQTAVDTMDMFLYQMAGFELPSDLRNLPREVAARRAAQGVPLHSFLEAVRNDFRVLWKGLERVADGDGVTVLVSNMDRVMDVVEGYVSSIQQSFVEAEALLARDKQLYRQRLISRLFTGEPKSGKDIEDICAGVGVKPLDVFEVIAVIGDAVPAAQRAFLNDRRCHSYDRAGVLYVFRVQRRGHAWLDEPPPFPAGYVQDVAGLTAVPGAAASALVLARSGASGLQTMDEAWMRIAADLLEQTLPGFCAAVHEAMARCTEHERQRLLQVAESYARTGSIKETAEELYCHRNTVVNRLHSLQQVIGLDLAVPGQAAKALIALSSLPEFPHTV